jgi:hypothetical protein
MLTIQSNLKIQDLETLAKTLIKPDIINFGLNKVGGGYTYEIADKVIAKLSKLDKNKIIVIINDITLQMADKLLEAGYNNIYLAFGRFNKDGSVSKDKTVYNIMKAIIKNNIKEKLNIISLEEIFNMKIDGVIANPPYGADGNKITETIINKVNYEEFINLLPLKDYTLETGKYIDFNEITTLPPHSFSDADILTHAVRILNKPDNTIKTFDALCAKTFTIDKPMIRFMRDNLAKKHYAFDNIKGYTEDANVKTTFVFHTLRIISQHTAGMDVLTEETVANSYNFNNIVKPEIIKKSGGSGYKAICLNSEIEKVRLVHIYKIARNFINRMIANQFMGIRSYAACWPKVDLTNSKWDSMTTEAEIITAIMKEVNNSTDAEIKAVLDTMTDDYTIRDDSSINRLFGKYLED